MVSKKTRRSNKKKKKKSPSLNAVSGTNNDSATDDLINRVEESTTVPPNEMVLTTEQLNYIDKKFGLKGYPKSNDLVVGFNYVLANQDDLAIDSYKRGAENDGCVSCMVFYVDMQFERNNVHLALPWALELSIRGHVTSFSRLFTYYQQSKPAPALALSSFWMKMMIELGDTQNTEEGRKGFKKIIANLCISCGKKESEDNNVTLVKCGICKHYTYCGKNCQTRHWQEGKHMNECRQVILLRKYCKPLYVKEIREALIGGQDPKEIHTLQRLRTKLGLIRPKEEYEELLLPLTIDDDNNNDNINSNRNRPDPYEYLVARKDGTVHIGSTQNII